MGDEPVKGGPHLREAGLGLALPQHGLGLPRFGGTGLPLFDAGSGLQFGQGLGLQVQRRRGPIALGRDAVQLGLGEHFVPEEPGRALEVLFGEPHRSLGIAHPGFTLGDLLGSGAPVQFQALGVGTVEAGLVAEHGGIQFLGDHPGQQVPRLHALAFADLELHEASSGPGTEVREVGLDPAVQEGAGIPPTGQKEQRKQEQGLAHGRSFNDGMDQERESGSGGTGAAGLAARPRQ